MPAKETRTSLPDPALVLESLNLRFDRIFLAVGYLGRQYLLQERETLRDPLLAVDHALRHDSRVSVSVVAEYRAVGARTVTVTLRLRSAGPNSGCECAERWC